MFHIGKALRLSDADFAGLASAYGVEETALRAVGEAEARDEEFYSSGGLVCLYEPMEPISHNHRRLLSIL